MKYRQGTCAECGAQFRVPASFQADRAKCKHCSGVVEIGPVEGGEQQAKQAPAPKPAAKPVPAKKPVPKPAPKPVAKAAPAQTAKQPAAKPAPKAEPRKAAPAAAKPRVRSKPAAAKTPAAQVRPKSSKVVGKESVRAAAETAAERVKTGSSRTSRAAAGAVGAAAGGAAARRSSRKTSGGSSSRRSGSRGSSTKKKSPAPLLALAGLVLIGGGGAWWFLRDDGTGAQAAEKNQVVADAAGAVEETDAAAQKLADDAAAKLEQDAADKAAEEAAAAAAAEAPEEATADPVDEGAPDLGPDPMLLPVLDKLPLVSDEDWASIQEDAATFIDPEAGAAGNRARARLLPHGRAAFPALLNTLRGLDYETEEGFRNGDLVQKLLEDICNGTNVGWQYSTEPKHVKYNRKAVKLWHQHWERASTDPEKWAELSKQELEDALKDFAVTGPDTDAPAEDGGADEELEDF